jgi:putative acetyltransferase
MQLQSESPENIAATRSLLIAAFGRLGEADLVDRLRAQTSIISFVALQAGQVIGHILFSPVAIAQQPVNLFILGLAPVAVHPDWQRQGIGSTLIRHGLREIAQAGCRAVVVLGSPSYYGRLGWMPAKLKGLTCEYPVPEDAFMVLELAPNALAGCAGTVKYHAAFNLLTE